MHIIRRINKMKKGMRLLLGAVAAVTLLTGCGIECKFTVDKSDTVSLKEEIYFTKDEFETLYGDLSTDELKENGYVGKKKVDGVQYYLFRATMDDYDVSQFGEGAVLNSKEFYYSVADQQTDDSVAMSDEDTQNMEEQLQESFSFVDFSVTFPYKVVATNGTLSKDKKTVTFEGMGKNADDVTIYAYTTKSKRSIDSDKTKPTVSGVKDGKKYSKAVTITFSDKDSGVKKATLNGKTFKSGTKVSKKGKYTLKVTDYAGNTKTVKFTIK